MITAIEIENFRSFSDRQRIEVTPITLMYGPNNSGKSTVMYALLLFDQLFRQEEYNRNFFELAGNELDLGPSYFATHNRQSGKPICIKLEFIDDDNGCSRSVEVQATPGKNDARMTMLRRFTGDIVTRRLLIEVDGEIEEGEDEVNGVKEMLEAELLPLRVISALRDIPPPHFEARIPDEVSRSLWFRGLAAWHWIGQALEDNLIFTNQWLGPEYLDTGVEFVQQRMLDADRLLELLDRDLPRSVGKNVDRNALTMCIQEALFSSERRVRLRPLQGNEIASGEAPLLLPSEVGVGISQILPVVVACMTRNGTHFMIQEPESHVHPRLQARLGDLMIDSTADHLSYGRPNRLLIESHSEHIIHRLKRRIRETTRGKAPLNLELTADRVVINYFNQENGATKVQQIHLDINGEFVEPWPDDFFDLDFNERFS
jgi:hypothetical protein